MTAPCLRVVDVAARLGISRAATYELIAAGTLACYRIGATIRVGEDHLADYLRSVDEAADLLACDPATLRRVYRKYDPSYLLKAVRALEGR